MKYVVLITMLLEMAFAVQLTPMAQKITSAKNRNVVFDVINAEKRLAASEFEVLRITGHTADGKEIREDTDHVVIYPPQFIIKAQASKKVRVSYRKKALPALQEVYRVISRELPIKVEEVKADDKVKAGVKFLFTYEGLLFVGGDQKVSALDVSFKSNKKNSVEFNVKNLGNMSEFVSATSYKMVLKTSKGNVTLDKSYFGKFNGLRLLPNETFVFKASKIKKLKGATVTGVTLTKQSSTKK